MTDVTEQSEVEENLGAEFWSQPQTALTETFNFLYAQSLAALREIVRERDGNIVDFMLVERLAFSYALLRQRESDVDNPISDRTRREMNKDWLEFTLALKKLWFSEDKTDVGEVLIRKLDKAVFSATKDLPEAKAMEIKGVMADVFEQAGL